jgi:hypothetical protein
LRPAWAQKDPVSDKTKKSNKANKNEEGVYQNLTLQDRLSGRKSIKHRYWIIPIFTSDIVLVRCYDSPWLPHWPTIVMTCIYQDFSYTKLRGSLLKNHAILA